MKYIIPYYTFITENIEMAKSIMKKKGEDFEKLKILLSKNMGLIGKFTEFLYQNVSYDDLKNLYDDILYLRSKNVSFDFSGLKYEKTIDEIIKLKNEISIKSFTNQFPSEQKNLIRSKSISSSFKNALLKCSKKDPSVFISKISRYKTIGDLENAIFIFSKDKNNNKEEVLKYIESSDTANLVLDKENYLIVNISDIKDVKILGSDTSWCILGESMWANYTKGRYQFILYDYNLDDFDPKFKIGFTLNPDGSIRACHDILDHYATDELHQIFSQLKIDFKSLVPDIEKEAKENPLTDLEISKINSRVSKDNLTSYVNRCPKDKMPSLVKKILDLFDKSQKRYESISPILSKLLVKYFQDKQYIYENDFYEIDKRLKYCLGKKLGDRNYRFDYRIIFNTLQYNSEIPDGALIENIKNWSSESIHNESTILFFEKFRGRPKSISELFFNRMDNIYKNDEFNFNSDLNKHLKGYKKKHQFEICYLLFGLFLGKNIPDQQHIVDSSSQSDKDDIVEYIDIPIDLDGLYNVTLTDKLIRNVIKKDYSDTSIYIRKSNYLQCLKLIEHLDGHKILLKITKADIRDIIKNFEKYRLPENSILTRVLRQFTVNSIRVKLKSEGNLTVKIM